MEKNQLNYNMNTEDGSSQILIHFFSFLFLFYQLNGRPDFMRTTKKRKSAIGSIEYTIKKRNRNGKIQNKKNGIPLQSRRKSGMIW